MAKLKLQPDPTFKAKVAIPVPGGRDELVEFTFIYRNRDDLLAFLDRIGTADKLAAAEVLEMCSGWDLTDPFNIESLEVLALNYVTAPRAIFDKYIDELTKARAKN